MPGLMESLAAGAASGFSNATQQNNAAEISSLNRKNEFSIREMMDARIAEREQSRYDRNRSDLKDDRDATHQNRLEEIKAMKDPNDVKMKALQLKQVMEESKVPPAIRTEYKSLDDSAKAIQAAMTKATAEGAGDPAGMSNLASQLDKIRSRQQDLLSSLPDYVAKKGSSLDDLFPLKNGQKSATSGKDW